MTSDDDERVREKLLEKEIECKNCGAQPVAAWRDGRILLRCECGAREIPQDAVLNHRWMPDGVEWTVIDG